MLLVMQLALKIQKVTKACRAAVHGVAKRGRQLSKWSTVTIKRLVSKIIPAQYIFIFFSSTYLTPPQTRIFYPLRTRNNHENFKVCSLSQSRSEHKFWVVLVLLVTVMRKKLKWPRWIYTFCRQYFRAIVIKMCAVVTKTTFHLHTFEWVLP